MRTVALCGAMLVSLAVVGTANANMLVNGGLETTTKLNASRMVYVSSSKNPNALNGWTISSGTVDIVSTKVLKSSAGNFSVDLIGTAGLGGIQQTVQTVSGTQYTLTFDFSVNPTHRPRPYDEFADTKVLQVTAISGGGSQGNEEVQPAIGQSVLHSQTYSSISGTRTKTNMQYSSQTFSFTGDGSPVTLVFSALTPLNLGPKLNNSRVRCGPVIDNVDLEIAGGNSVPEPASLAILGMGGLLLVRRGTRKHA